MQTLDSFSTQFFDHFAQGSINSAKEIVPFLLSLIQPKSVVDVGCGTQTWLKIFFEAGVKDVLGVDGKYVDSTQLELGEHFFVRQDIGEPFNLGRSFDLAITLEAVHYLPADKATTLVQSLTEASDVVLFSAALPGQGGFGHSNEQWPDYWSALFAARGYTQIDIMRRQFWNNQNVKFWYKQNMFLYVKEERAESLFRRCQEISIGQQAFPARAVHPELYEKALRQREAAKERCAELEQQLENQSKQLSDTQADAKKLQSEFELLVERLRNLEEISLSTIVTKLPKLAVARIMNRLKA